MPLLVGVKAFGALASSIRIIIAYADRQTQGIHYEANRHCALACFESLVVLTGRSGE